LAADSLASGSTHLLSLDQQAPEEAEALAEALAFYLSAESLIAELGGEAPLYSDALFYAWLERASPLPYSEIVAELVYEDAADVGASDILAAIGEEGLAFALAASLYPPLDELLEEALSEAIEARLAEVFVSKGLDGKLFDVVEALASSGFPRRKAAAAVLAHLVNKALISMRAGKRS